MIVSLSENKARDEMRTVTTHLIHFERKPWTGIIRHFPEIVQNISTVFEHIYSIFARLY